MRLRRPCEHGKYDAHDWGTRGDYECKHGPGVKHRFDCGTSRWVWYDRQSCPGGEFLPEDAAVLIRKHPEHGYPYIEEAEPREWGEDDFSGWYIRVASPSLTYRESADQVGEPG